MCEQVTVAAKGQQLSDTLRILDDLLTYMVEVTPIKELFTVLTKQFCMPRKKLGS